MQLKIPLFCFPKSSTPATDCFEVPSNFPGTLRRLRNSSLWSSNSPRRFHKVAAENYRKTNVAFELRICSVGHKVLVEIIYLYKYSVFSEVVF